MRLGWWVFYHSQKENHDMDLLWLASSHRLYPARFTYRRPNLTHTPFPKYSHGSCGILKMGKVYLVLAFMGCRWLLQRHSEKDINLSGVICFFLFLLQQMNTAVPREISFSWGGKGANYCLSYSHKLGWRTTKFSSVPKNMWQGVCKNSR